ncbi:PREDICTED: tyrosine-protein kinase Drl [Drosophila arizonae]|uniref:Tyrosine-protein kinase Drl n=1 Tax=Drosophila arizonae TaxID=7263 RepID=A0ABM1NWD0_DROAR|nr:PREDICTED: tyrosine-protein kinase Drl [Drosophila arizonae]
MPAMEQNFKGLFTIGLFLALLSGGQTHLNIFLNLHEVLRLIGVSAELYYVREGAINDYALNFAVPVPANISDVTFTWQSLVEHPLPYSINVATSDVGVLPRPLLNISRIGNVPQEPQTWGVSLKCSGTRAAEVTVTISVEVILDRATNNNTNLIFKRKKICLKDEPNDAREEYDDEEPLHPDLTGHDDIHYTEHNEDTAEHVISDGHLPTNVEHGKPTERHRVLVTEPTVIVGRGAGAPGAGAGAGANNDYDPMLRETLVPPTSGLITLIVGGILALVLVSTLILIAYCAKGPSKRHPSNGVHLIKTSSFQRLPTISSTAHNSIYVCPSTITPTYATLTRPFREYEHEPEEFNRRLQELTVQKCRVRLSCLVQEGNFGRIYRGTYNDCQEVLVKTVAQHASQLQVNLLLQESMMLYEATHPNVMAVLGISIEDFATPFVLYAATGSVRNLKTFLQDPSYARSVTTIQTVLMASQLAMAMEHLHNHGVIHKDIAARNCVIDDQLRVKLTDSALSRDLFSGDYNCLGDGEYRPIKWLSLEALQKSHYNEGSDVWSFGVLMWEMCTLGKLPYAEIDPYEMEHYLKDGYRLAQPFNCPDELFTIMAYCWASMPAERPSFSQLQICLSEFHTQITRYV